MARAVDGAGAVTGHGVEPALLAENLLADDRDGGRKQDAQRADLAQGHFHRLGHAEADAVRRLGDMGAELIGQLARLDVRKRNGAALRAGHALFRDEQHVAGLGQHGLAVLLGHVKDVVLIRDQVGLDGQALIAHAVDLNDVVFPRIGVQLLFHDECSLFI